MSRVEAIEHEVEQLPLDELAERIARRRWALEQKQRMQTSIIPATAADPLTIRSHGAFLGSYSPEDEGVYDARH